MSLVLTQQNIHIHTVATYITFTAAVGVLPAFNVVPLAPGIQCQSRDLKQSEGECKGPGSRVVNLFLIYPIPVTILHGFPDTCLITTTSFSVATSTQNYPHIKITHHFRQ